MRHGNSSKPNTVTLLVTTASMVSAGNTCVLMLDHEITHNQCLGYFIEKVPEPK
jgi:hypothetical protein